MERKKRKSIKKKQQRYFMIYVSGDYEEVYIKSLHTLLHEQCSINFFIRCYHGGEDFEGGFHLLKKDLESQRVTKNLERAEAILIQGDMDVRDIVKRIPKFEDKAKTFQPRTVYLIPSKHSFESWIKAHFTPITSQNEIVKKYDIDNWIPKYSHDIKHAQRYFEKNIDLKKIKQAAHPETGNTSFYQFLEKINILECINSS